MTETASETTTSINSDVTQIRPCPPWCAAASDDAAHALETHGFHHDSTTTYVELGDGPARDAARVEVAVSRYQPFPDEDGGGDPRTASPEPYPPHVELHAPSNAGSTALTLLSPVEARSLAAALVTAADMAEAD